MDTTAGSRLWVETNEMAAQDSALHMDLESSGSATPLQCPSMLASL